MESWLLFCSCLTFTVSSNSHSGHTDSSFIFFIIKNGSELKILIKKKIANVKLKFAYLIWLPSSRQEFYIGGTIILCPQHLASFVLLQIIDAKVNLQDIKLVENTKNCIASRTQWIPTLSVSCPFDNLSRKEVKRTDNWLTKTASALCGTLDIYLIKDW